MKHHVVILGAGYAGLLAGLRLSRRLRDGARVALVSAGDDFVERIRLHQIGAGQSLPRHSLGRLLEGSGVEFLRAEVEAIDLARGELRAGALRLPYDELLLAVGSRVDTRPICGLREHAFTLDASDAPRLARQLHQVAGARGRVLVCGAGLSGIELAAELSSAWPTLQLTLLTRGELGPHLSAAARGHIRSVLGRRGVEVQEGVRVTEIERGLAWGAGGERVEFDVCVWAGGFRAPELAAEAGLDVRSSGQVRVGPELRSLSHPEVWAIGDVAGVEAKTSAPLVCSCKIALPMALHAADNLARRRLGLAERSFDFRDSGVCVSLGRDEGVIDWRHPDGSVKNRVLTGAWAARVKEWVCRFTVARQRWERSGWWPASALGRAPVTLDSSRRSVLAP